MTRFTKTTLATALLLAATGVSAAEGDISANVALATDYMFRGVSQTDNQFAISGGFDWSHASGIYLGTWASNVNFGTAPDPSTEIDLYAGYSGKVGDIGYDLGFLHYDYPGASELDTNEVYVGASYSYFSAKLSYSNDLAFVSPTKSDSATYLDLGAEYEVMDNVTVSAHVGWSNGDAFKTASGNKVDGYVDYKLGVSTSFKGVDLALDYIDSDSDAETLFGTSLTDSRVMFTISKSF